MAPLGQVCRKHASSLYVGVLMDVHLQAALARVKGLTTCGVVVLWFGTKIADNSMRQDSRAEVELDAAVALRIKVPSCSLQTALR